MDIGIRGRPYFVLPLTRQHIDALITLSQHHYDARCKMASLQGGFIYGWNNSLRFNEEYGSADDTFTVDASDGDVQTVMKILESIPLCAGAKLIDAEAATLCRSLSRDLHGAYSLSSNKYYDWQTTYEGSK